MVSVLDNPTSGSYLKHLADALNEEHNSVHQLASLGAFAVMPKRESFSRNVEQQNSKNCYWMNVVVFVFDHQDDTKEHRHQIVTSVKHASNNFCTVQCYIQSCVTQFLI